MLPLEELTEETLVDCYECGCQLSPDNVNLSPDDEECFCQDCYQERFATCDDCGDVVDRDEIGETGNGSNVCNGCIEDHYFHCESCGAIEHCDESHSTPNDEYYCEDCYDEHCTCCEQCGETLWNDDSYSTPSGYSNCERCFYDYFGCCSDCGETYSLDDMHYDEDSGENYCENCDCGGSSQIKRWNYMPRLNFYKSKWEKTLLFLGMELEVQTRSSMRDRVENLYQMLKNENLENLFYFKQDGSVCDGFEIVSHPFTLNYGHKNINYYKILKHLKRSGFTSYESGDCGLHVHLSRNFFSAKEIRKMRLFFCSSGNQIQRFSYRGDKTNYCKKVNYNLRQYKEKDDYQPERYLSLNCNTGKGTLEIRVFRGTLLYRRFLASLQFSDAVAHFVKQVSFMALGKESSWKTFCLWLKQQNRYNHLIRFMKYRNIYVI